MFTVRFSYDEPAAPVVDVFTSASIEESCQFALSFHRASNVPHQIVISDPSSKECVVFKLSRKPVK